MHLPSPANMGFELRARSTATGRLLYGVEDEKKMKLQTKIVDAINEKLQGQGMSYLLVGFGCCSDGDANADISEKESLASCQDVKSRPCDKCSRLLDRNGQFPVLRIHKKDSQAHVQNARDWIALHLSCS